MVVGISCPASESARPFLSTQFCLPVHHSGGGGTLDQAVAPVAGETESGCGLWLGKPELGERGDIWRTEPMGRAVLINGPPTSTIRSLGPVNFHGFEPATFGERPRTDSVSPGKVGQHQSSTVPATLETRPASSSSNGSGCPRSFEAWHSAHWFPAGTALRRRCRASWQTARSFVRRVVAAGTGQTACRGTCPRPAVLRNGHSACGMFCLFCSGGGVELRRALAR